MKHTKTIVAIACASVFALTLAGCGGSSTSKSSDAETTKAAASAETTVSDYVVTIDSATMTTDYQGNPAVAVSYTFTNNSEEAEAFLTACNETVYQNGVECQTAISTDIDTSASTAKVQPGATVSCQMVYSVSDSSDIDVEVTELFSLDDTKLAEQTFTLA